MKIVCKAVLYVWICITVSFALGNRQAAGAIVYRGASDSSAAVAVDKDMFIAADDENNILRIYRTDVGGMPVYSYDLTEFLGTEREHPEADIEGGNENRQSHLLDYFPRSEQGWQDEAQPVSVFRY